jgi:hypothetical protein
MISQLKASLILLAFLSVIFSIPIVAVGYSVHGFDLALLAALGIIVLVFIGPISFLFASSIATGLELTVIAVFGTVTFFAWLRTLALGPGYYIPYLPVTSWALMGAYFCVSLFFVHATT